MCWENYNSGCDTGYILAALQLLNLKALASYDKYNLNKANKRKLIEVNVLPPQKIERNMNGKES